MRIGPGPVFLYECLANSRRWQTYAIRSVGVAILLAAIATIAMSHRSIDPLNAWRDYAELGESYFYAIIGVELTLVMLAAPAATAGAICVDRARGTLAHMLMTELSDAEIVLGKLGARLLPILGLVACTWPVLAICSLLGGIDPLALTWAFAIILAVALLGCTMAMALSVWARRPHEVVLVTYTFWMLFMLIRPVWFGLSRAGLVAPPSHWSLVADPFYLAFAPYVAPNTVSFWKYLGFFTVALGLPAVLTIVAVRRMRPVACRGAGDRRKATPLSLVGRITRRLPGPSLDENPVLWREWHRTRPSRWLMILIAIVGGTTGIACVAGAVLIWAQGLDDFRSQWGVFLGVGGYCVQLIFGLLMLSAVAPTSMAEERQRGSLDLLATTTLSTRSIVVGKWLGTLRLVPLLAIGPGLVGLALATAHKSPSGPSRAGVPVGPSDLLSGVESVFGVVLLVATILVHGALIASVGVALAVWIKRQSRAIAASVAFAVMMNVGLPAFVGSIRIAGRMLCLSPVLVAGAIAEILADRIRQQWHFLWLTAFWDIECLVLALGLLWLTVRTFDRCLGRIPERPRRTPVLSDVVVLLSALIGVGAFGGASRLWFHGLGLIGGELDFWTLACAFGIAVGLVLLAVMAPLSISAARTPRAMTLEASAPIVGRRWFVIRWWESFRLVLLLAIGPALIGLALAMIHRPLMNVPKVTTLPDGSKEEIATQYPTGVTYVHTTDASGRLSWREATAEEIAGLPFVPTRSRTSLLTTGVLAVLTVLAHGAWVVGLGLALGIGLRRRGLAIGACVGVFLFVTVLWPILYYHLRPYSPFHSAYPRGLILASPVPVIFVLLVDYPPDPVFLAEIVWWTTFWVAMIIAMAIAVSALAIGILDRRSRADPSSERDAEDERPAIETVLVGD
jgi:ABC-type transport system involved in multi-copper enzyme maturation permease subunit